MDRIPQEGITLSLSHAEALVLYEFLSRESERNATSEYEIADPAELRVLWDLEAMLESRLVEPMRADYDEHLSRARDEVRDSGAGA